MALRPDQTPPPQTPKTPRQPGSWLRLALLAGLSLYIVILLSPVLSKLGGPARVDLSYSQLVTQIESGNVANITIQGQNAQGDLKTTFSNNGVTNTQFSATVPDNVGLTDPTFFPLLKSNHVATVVKPDTRIVPADGKLLTGADIVRYRDIYQKLFTQMFDYFNKGFGPSDAAAARPLKDYENELGDASVFLAGAYRSLLQAYVPD